MILLFDDEKSIRENVVKEIKGQKIPLRVVETETKQELKRILNDKQTMSEAKVLIFDLSTTKEEAETGKFEILELIRVNYNIYAIPIFVHSAFADQVAGYDEVGTVFLIKKDSDSIKRIIDKVKSFHESGFLDIFCPNGYLEKEIHKSIQKAFNNQFKGEEISKIIESISVSSRDNLKERVVSVFERIAIRSLYQNLVSAKRLDASDVIEEVKINAVEHYYRRTSEFPVWTGDIFIDSDNIQVLVITPRCDINNGVCNNSFLVCEIERIDGEVLKSISKDVGKYLNDNPQQSGIKSRFLVPAPNYSGGKVNLTIYYKLDISLLFGEKSRFQYLISLSDELTNDIIRKFASYILRGGISASDISEASFYARN